MMIPAKRYVPAPKLVEEGRPNTTFAIATSDAFFERPKNRVRAQGSQLALIDGDHSRTKALRDFENLEAVAAPNSIIAIHDVVPITWMPERQRRRPRQRSRPIGGQRVVGSRIRTIPTQRRGTVYQFYVALHES